MYKNLIAGVALAAGLGLSFGALAADIPKSTQKALDELKLGADALKGLDEELAVPQAWIDAAKAEKETIVSGTWEPKEFRDMTAAFRERYPFVNLKYERTGTAGRGMTVLVALGEGRVIVDVVTSLADAIFEYMEAKALAPLTDMPTYKTIEPKYRAADGTWVSHKLSFRCMAYNTEHVKKSELPATWEDLVNSPRFAGGKLALTNNPSTWLLGLWGDKGEKWGEEYTKALFEKLQPQRRKEGLTALTGLTVAGEFDLSLPSPEWVAERYAKKGAPLGYHCPTPVPITVSGIAIIDKSPRKNAARLFVNWLQSKEGQIVQYTSTLAVPAHKDLQDPRFVPFADTIVGKPANVRDDALLLSETNKKMGDLWDSYWNAGASGAKP